MKGFAIREECVRDIVETTMRCHPRDCVFITDAVGVITATVIARVCTPSYRPLTASDVIDIMQEEFRRAELYCPHEGIDRMPRP